MSIASTAEIFILYHTLLLLPQETLHTIFTLNLPRKILEHYSLRIILVVCKGSQQARHENSFPSRAFTEHHHIFPFAGAFDTYLFFL